MNNFDVKFKQLTNNLYPYLRFISAEFSREKNQLKLVFLIAAQSYDKLTEQVRADVSKFVAPQIPDGITFAVDFVKTTADNESVVNRILQFFRQNEPNVFQTLSENDIKVEISDNSLKVEISLLPNIFALFDNDGFKEKFTEYLEDYFVENTAFSLKKKFMEKEELAAASKEAAQKLENSDSFSIFEEGSVILDNARFIKAKPVKVLYGRDGLSAYPMYISDIKNELSSAVLCGKVQGLSKRMYTNKNYNTKQDEKKSRFKRNTVDETLPLYAFNLDDTTGVFPVVIFPFDNNNAGLDSISEGDTVMCQGSLRRNRSDILQLNVSKLWSAEIDFEGTSKMFAKKTVASTYSRVAPVRFESFEQLDMFSESVAEFLKDKVFVVFDLETTGLDIQKVKIVQLAAYKIVNGAIVEEFSTLINPQIKIPPESSNIHKITDDMVVNSPTIEEVLPDFYKFTRGASLVGHNAVNYDYPILNRFGLENGYVFDNKVLDTYLIAKQNIVSSSYKLDSLCKILKVELANAHNAADDALATAQCFIALAKNLK